MSQSHTIQLDALQLAWLQELGVEAALLRSYAPQRAQPSIPTLPAPTPLQDADHGAQRVHATTRQAVAAGQSPVRQDEDKHGSLPMASKAPLHRGGEPPSARPAGLSTAPPSARPQAPLRRTPHLACQVYTPHVGTVQSTPAENWLIVSETPTLGDARTLIPGRAAQLLDAMLAAIGLQASDALWRFPAPAALSSPPTATDSAPACQDQMEQIKNQVTALRPACILALGRAAATVLLQTTETLQSLRGKVWLCSDAAGLSIPVVVTYPPGWLLANPQHKIDAWRDLLLARAAQTIT